MSPRTKVYIPYLSVAKVDKILEYAKTRTMNKVSTSMFSGYGFNTTDAALAVKFLKFLKVIDEDGNASSLMTKLQIQTEEKRSKAIEEIVRDSYELLFSASATKEPQNFSPNELADEIRVQYNQSQRVAKTAVPVFFRLCEYAGLKETGSVTTKIHKPRESKVPKTIVAKDSRDQNSSNHHRRPALNIIPPIDSFHIQFVVKDKAGVITPNDWGIETPLDDELDQLWKVSLKALHAYAKKYQEKHPDLSAEEKESDST